MSNEISTALDGVAESLESKGFVREAYELDRLADIVDTPISPTPLTPPTPSTPLVKGEIQPMRTPGSAEDQVQYEKKFSDMIKALGVSDHTWAMVKPAEKEAIRSKLKTDRMSLHNLFFMTNTDTQSFIRTYPHDSMAIQYLKQSEDAAKKVFSECPIVLNEVLKNIQSLRTGHGVGVAPYPVKLPDRPQPSYDIPKLSSMLDDISDRVEAGGLVREAYEIDRITVSL
jgi:hypothetical protein